MRSTNRTGNALLWHGALRSCINPIGSRRPATTIQGWKCGRLHTVSRAQSTEASTARDKQVTRRSTKSIGTPFFVNPDALLFVGVVAPAKFHSESAAQRQHKSEPRLNCQTEALAHECTVERILAAIPS